MLERDRVKLLFGPYRMQMQDRRRASLRPTNSAVEPGAHDDASSMVALNCLPGGGDGRFGFHPLRLGWPIEWTERPGTGERAKTMKQTKHRKLAGQDAGTLFTVDQDSYLAVQFDFYIPALIYELPKMSRLRKSLSDIEGATVFENETGIWEGEPENTHVFRVILRPGKLDLDDARTQIKQVIGDFMVEISDSEHKQQAIMFTETRVEVSVAKNVKKTLPELQM